ncbi:MAG: hypothetical protein CMK92_02650 [Pseudomonas sp.]|nr:hypothetical protein [Pseudomonas sp.]
MCEACFQSVLDTQAAQHEIVRLGWSNGNAPVPVSFNQEMINGYQQMTQCLNRCKSVVMTQISQANLFEWDSSCEVDQIIMNEFRTALQGNLSQTLNDNSGVLESFMGILAPGDKQTTIAMINNRVASRINQEFVTKLINDIRNQQNITFTGDSLNVNGVSQQSAFNGVARLTSTQNVLNSVFTDSEWAVQQALYNDNSTIGQLGNVLNKTVVSIGDVIDDVFGAIMTAVVILAIIAVSAVAVIGFIQLGKKKGWFGSGGSSLKQ